MPLPKTLLKLLNRNKHAVTNNITFIDLCNNNKPELEKFLEVLARLTFAKSLNKPTRRFKKSEIIDSKLSDILNIKYVDEVAYDAIWNDKKISIKTEQELFQRVSKSTKQITMANLNGNNSEEKICNVEFDYLLLISTAQKGISVVDRDNVIMNLCGSQLKTQISFDKMKFIIEPSYKIKKYVVNDEKNNQIDCYIKECNNNIYNSFI